MFIDGVGDAVPPGEKTFAKLGDEHFLKFPFGVLVGEVVGEKESGVVLWKQVHECPVPLAAAIVQERTFAISLVYPETIGPPGSSWILSKVLGVHESNGFWPENAAISIRSSPQMGDQKATNVGTRREEHACRRHLEVIRRQSTMLSPDPLVRHSEIFRNRSNQRSASPHAQRREDLVLYVIGERTTCYFLHEVTDHRKSMMRVTNHTSRYNDCRPHR